MAVEMKKQEEKGIEVDHETAYTGVEIRRTRLRLMREGLFREIMKMTEESTRRSRGMWMREEVSMKSKINRMKKIGVVLNAGLIIFQVDEIVKGAEVLKQLKIIMVVGEVGEDLEDQQEEEEVDLMEEEEVLITEDQEEVEDSEEVIWVGGVGVEE